MINRNHDVGTWQPWSIYLVVFSILESTSMGEKHYNARLMIDRKGERTEENKRKGTKYSRMTSSHSSCEYVMGKIK